jgi:FkbM family methyltransferase
MNFATINQLPFKVTTAGLDKFYYRLRVEQFWFKEPETLSWIDDFDDICLFWDIGANIGLYSLYCAYKHPGAIITAFEPFLPNYNRLKADIEANGWDNRIRAAYVALSNETGMANFESKQQTVGSSGGQIGAVSDFVPQNTNPVQVTTGDEYLHHDGCPNYVKIDVDGKELQILQGMQQVLENKALRGVLVEQNQDRKAIQEILTRFDFVPDAAINRLKLRKNDYNTVWKRL